MNQFHSLFTAEARSLQRSGLILATHSAGKIRELTALLAPIPCIPQEQLHISSIEETGLSFIENAIIKARHASQYSTYPALADDSGLVIDALQGRPGIYSARFARHGASDAENIQKVLTLMDNIEESSRQAYFYCAIALVRYPDDPTPILATGRLDGQILRTPLGTKGFGYDPIFFLPSLEKTLAECSTEEKNKWSHRAQALTVLQEYLLAEVQEKMR
ncbi:MAG TPA: RdgB/HAM1 family non-canonical purine NTP pyrophosphatase [Legionellaceae bacterium]|nr:RdgB/HAM1 family non-canonical purine NTP pyrophosphatase [Legionellaceae bacterium]